jgi:hypothetical protein
MYVCKNQYPHKTYLLLDYVTEMVDVATKDVTE